MTEKCADVSVVKAKIKKQTKKSNVPPSSAGNKHASISRHIDFPLSIDPCLRHQMITEAAYYLAERRGFISGYELEDWLTAELEIDARQNL